MDTLPPRVNYGYYSPIPASSGIYRITCAITKKFYIGSAVNLRDRYQVHFRRLRLNKHENPHLQRAWNKHGEHAFTFEIIELVLIPFLIEREQYWIDKTQVVKKGFNIAPNAGSALGRKHSPETIEKIRESNRRREMSPETLEKMRQSHLGQPSHNRGKKTPPETREKIRQASLGKKLSTETREKLRRASLGQKHTPEQIEKQRQATLGHKKSPEAIKNIRQAALNRHKRPIEEMEAIRMDYASGMTYRQLAKKYVIGSTHLVQVLEGVSAPIKVYGERKAKLRVEKQEARQAKLQEEKLLGERIRADRDTGMTYLALAAKYGISKTQAGSIVKGEAWI